MFALLLSLALATELHHLPVSEAWKAWQVKYQDSETLLTHGADDDRFTIFAYHHAFVERHNSLNTTFTLELNQFAAMTLEEFQERNGFRTEPRPFRTTKFDHKMSGLNNPQSVDWRGKLVVPIKDQGSCGSCWAFSTVVSLEGQYAKLTEDLTSMSEQDLVDCVKNVKIPGSSQACCDGCQGGLMDYAFQYIMDSQSGVDDLEDNYRYTGRDGTCKFTKAKGFSDARVTGYTDLKSEEELEDATATVGPVSVAVNANTFWQLYHGGVLDPVVCNGNRLDHGVAVVGYGVDGGKDYWIVRNSWGKSWGEEGYVRLVKGSNKCGIANGPPSYPKVVSN